MATHDFQHVPVARSLMRRAIGLMGRTDLARLLLVIPRCSVVHTGFMGASIDIVFLDRDGMVVSIVHRARSWRIYGGPRGTHSVLEIPAGHAKACGLNDEDVVLVDRT